MLNDNWLVYWDDIYTLYKHTHSYTWRISLIRVLPYARRVWWYYRWRLNVFVHNLKNYDSHFLLKAIDLVGLRRLSSLAEKMEKFKTLTVDRTSFIDSAQLISSSLESLVRTLEKSKHPFPLLDKFAIAARSPRHKKLLLRKGVYPYEWASSVESVKGIPSKDSLYSSLTL